MQKASKRRTPRWGLRLTCLVGVIFLCRGDGAGYACAQSAPGDPATKVKREDESGHAFDLRQASILGANARPVPKTNNRARALTKPKPKLAPGLKKGATPNARKRSAKSRFTMNPGAKWACDKQTVSLDPVWRGNQQLTFGFDIRNEGTADLQIKARGG